MNNNNKIEMELELLAVAKLNTWFTSREDVRNFVDLVNQRTGKSYRDRLTDYVQSAINGYQDLTDGIDAKNIATAAIDIAEAGSDSVLNNVINLLDIENAEHNND
ncbi:hypothetical protein DN445_03850 [Lactobacillus reuteri]|uniref:hypothetical protein n=1 Tax=Limosilactobacillus reuteri TaxID=1598 RepID=UPI00128E03A6|nr:hypothetical protein [Limosilactobacillus reuteri]MQB70980.1 hypothetical protein [Limosilactobacillus reuteri]